MAAPANRRPTSNPPAKPFPVLQLVGIAVMSALSIGMIVFLMMPREDNKPAPPPRIETKPATAPKAESKPSSFKDIPDAVRKEILKRLDDYSTKVNEYEHEEMAVEKLTDPQEIFDAYDKLSDKYAELREGIGDVLEDPKYSEYRNNEAYGPMWKGFEGRLTFYQSKMNVIKKKRDGAFIALRNAKEKAAGTGK
jgi:hypothetical protein